MTLSQPNPGNPRASQPDPAQSHPGNPDPGNPHPGNPRNNRPGPGHTAPGHAHSPTGPTGPGSVLLELGGHIGALILQTPPGLAGHEIEISPSAGGPRTHAQVRERVTAAGVSHAAVYPNLTAADYVIWRDAATPLATVTVRPATPTTYHWPDHTD